MSPKIKSTWFRWLSPGTLFPKSGKELEFDVSFRGVNDSEVPLKGPQPQFVLSHPENQFSKKPPPPIKKRSESRMVTISGSRCCSTLRHFLSEITVEPILFLYMLSTFSQYASFQDLVYSRSCLQNYPASTCDNLHSPEYSQEAEAVQAMTSHLILICTTALVLPSIFIAIYLGSWSDRFGRKWPIVFPPLGGVLACVVYIILAFQPHLPIQWVFSASFLSGLFGGFVSCIMSCMSYVSAISSEENRTVRISRLEAMIFLGGTVGPFLSGSLLEYIGHGYSFVFMLACYAIAFLYALFCVKEVKDNDPDRGHHGHDHDLPGNEGHSIRPHSAASSTSVASSSLKSSIVTDGGMSTRREQELSDHESAEQSLLSPEIKDFHLPDVARSGSEGVYITTTDLDHVDFNVDDPFHVPSVGYQPLNSGNGGNHHHSNFEDGSSTAPSEDEQKNILRRSRNSSEVEDQRNVSCCSKYFGSEHFFAALKTVIKSREGGRRAYLILTLVASYIGMMITAGELDVAYLFAKGEPLKWSHKTFSYYFGLKYMLGTLVLLIGMPLFQHFQIRDSTVCIVGLVSRIAGLILYALSPNTTVAFMVPILAICSFFSIPATRSLLSKLVSPDEQGKIFAFVAIMEDLCTMTASMVFNSLYPLTRQWFPVLKGLIFLMAAALLIVPILIMWFIGRKLTKLERLESSANVKNLSHRSEPSNHL